VGGGEAKEGEIVPEVAMILRMKKNCERFFVEAAAKLMAKHGLLAPTGNILISS
jgi:hypothetical protein